MRNFVGHDGFIWWVGVVEDNVDPMTLGRCKVRIFGYHPPAESGLVSTDDLPWAVSIHPINLPNLYGAPEKGYFVFGFFLDGLSAQEPAIIGYFPGRPSTSGDKFGATWPSPNFEWVKDSPGSNKIELDFGNNFITLMKGDVNTIKIKHNKLAEIFIDDDSNIKMTTPGTFTVYAEKDMLFQSNGNIDIVTGGGDTGKVGGNINIKSGKAIETYSKSTTTIKSNTEMLLSSGKELTAKSNNDMMFESGKAYTAKSNNDMLFDSGKAYTAKSNNDMMFESGKAYTAKSNNDMLFDSSTSLTAKSNTTMALESGTTFDVKSKTAMSFESDTTFNAKSKTAMSFESDTTFNAKSKTAMSFESDTTISFTVAEGAFSVIAQTSSISTTGPIDILSDGAITINGDTLSLIDAGASITPTSTNTRLTLLKSRLDNATAVSVPNVAQQVVGYPI